MKKSNDANLIAVLAISVILGIILSMIAIHGPTRNVSVPSVTALPTSFPDVQNDPTYNSFMNPSALDPTQAVQVGNSSNTSPFNGGQ